MDVCADCETSGGLLACTGGCNRSFHAECIGERDAGASDAWRCPECLVSVHRCASCKRYANDADMVVCSQPSCGIRFHDTRECRDGSGVVAGACGRHRCHAPGCAVAADAPQTRCTRCVKAFHAACVPADAHVLSGSAFCCVAHALDGGSAAHGVDAAAAAASGRKRGRAIRDALAPSDSAGAAARAPAAPKGAPSLSAKGIVAVQQRAAAERRRAEAAAEAAETASLVSMARARNASGAGSAAPFSLVAAVSEAVAAASADEGLGSGSWTQVIPGRGRGAELASQRLNQTSAMAWHGPPETQRRQQQPSQTYSAPEHAPERGGASMGSSYGSAGGSTSYAAGLASAPPHAYYDPRQGGHSGEPLWHAPPPQPPALDLQATEGVDSEGRQIFVDAAGSGRAFVFNAYTGYPVEIFLQYPAEAASTHWHQSPDPQQQQLQLQQQWEQQQQQLWQQQQQQYHAQQWQEGSGCPGPLLGSDASGLPPKPDPYMLLRESGLESLLGSDSWEAGRAFLALLYPRFRCRVCAWRCGSKPELATHVAAHRAAAGGAAAAASVDELQAAHAAAPSTRAIALAGRGPVSESPAGGEPGGAAPSWSRDWLREVAEPLPDEPSAGAVAGSGGDP